MKTEIDGFSAIGKNAQGYDEYRHHITGMVFVLLPGGKFNMGSNDGVGLGPLHEVTLDPFLISKYEVTQAVWGKIMGYNPSKFKGDNNPVEMVSWYECLEFMKKTGLRFPTEAEWEYACRAGTTTKYYWGDKEDGDYMWYHKNSNFTTHPVGQKKPNGFGLYDMLGNVFEWCQDWCGDYPAGAVSNPKGPASGQRRVCRGGYWGVDASCCHSGARAALDPWQGCDHLGFRPAHDLK